MNDRTALMGGNKVTLEGPALRSGDRAPDFVLLDTSLRERRLSEYGGRIKLISVVPSLDTGVCDAQTRRFNAEASGLGSTVVLTVSMDLPFAQARWCGASGLEGVVTLSDHRTAEFGRAYGVLIRELRLLSRSVFIVDGKDVIRYAQYVGENHSHPDYEAALAALKKTVKEAQS